MQDPTDNRDVAIAVAPDPLDQLLKRVRVGEDVVGGLPIGVLVGIAKARHSERRAVGKRSSEVRRSGACEDCRLKSVNDIRRIIAEQLIVAGFATFPETLLELFATWTAALYDRKSSVTNRSGTKAYFFKSLRISFNAACLFRLDWTSTSRTSPSASTARQR